ncbi:hypothetical protein M0E87_12220 [Corynebacterium sp. CCM 9185]|uniref:Uncharacterized protein n=1 Tax=Corynebacterium marambiense TaxID=2765364 RepID=A0ABS0VXW9_9CORY|nr:hypothetical protein [Corynebacterium marambiense]MBI9001584.1 hypothetical protein [Corynebacterium marambiense]MCK7664408.1 hypothetical protein [Corynebacterium marambiense]
MSPTRAADPITTEHWICINLTSGRAGSCSTSELFDTALKLRIFEVHTIESFGNSVVAEGLDRINIEGNDRLTLDLADGTMITCRWNLQLKKSSWTPEKKAAWGELVRARWG